MNLHGHSRLRRLPTGLMLFSVVLNCATALFAPACGAATKTWTGRDSGNWSGASNWRPAGAPQNGENLLFDPAEVESSVRKEMHNDIFGLQVGRIDFCDFGWTLDGNELTLLDRVGFRQSQTNTCADNSFRFDCPLKLGATTRMATAEGGGTLFLRGYIDLNGNDLLLHSGDQIFVSGQILGNGNVIATVDSFFGADSKIVFDGPTGNTFSGKLTIRQIYDDTGVVIFDKQFGHVVNDALLIGDRDFSLSATPAVCKLANSHQIGDAAEVCVTGGSQLRLQGHTETIGSLCLTNNSGDTEATLVDTGGSTLSVQGDIIAVNDALLVVPTIRGKLGLPGPVAAAAAPADSARSAGLESAAANPKGIVSLSPGLRGTSYPGFEARKKSNPNGVASCQHRCGHNPFGVETYSFALSQGSSFLATLGLAPESRWDSIQRCSEAMDDAASSLELSGAASGSLLAALPLPVGGSPVPPNSR